MTDKNEVLRSLYEITGNITDHNTVLVNIAELETLRTGYAAARGDELDAARLDWLLRKLPGDALRRAVGELADTADGAEFRAAIDAARAAHQEGGGPMNVIAGWMIAVALFVGLGQIAKAIDKHQCGPTAAQEGNKP